MTFLWEKRGWDWNVREWGLLLAVLVMLDYEVGSAMASGIIPLVRNFGGPW